MFLDNIDSFLQLNKALQTRLLRRDDEQITGKK